MNTTTEKKKYHFRDFTTEYEEYNLAGAHYTVLYIHGLMGNPWSRRAETIKNTALNLGLNFAAMNSSAMELTRKISHAAILNFGKNSLKM